MILFLPVDHFRYGRSLAGIWLSEIGLPDGYKIFGLRVGERPVKNGVEDAEDSTVGGDAEGQGEDHHGQKARAFEQAASGEFYVRPDGLEIGEHAHLDGASWSKVSRIDLVRE